MRLEQKKNKAMIQPEKTIIAIILILVLAIIGLLFLIAVLNEMINGKRK